MSSGLQENSQCDNNSERPYSIFRLIPNRVDHEPAIPVAAALIFRDGRLLITQRPSGKHLAGLWEFPGGKVEAGESWAAALRRELREELGTEVVVGGLFEEVTHHYPGKTVRLRFFICAWRSGEPQSLECAAVAWVTATELDRYEFPPADAQLIQRLRREAWPPLDGAS